MKYALALCFPGSCGSWVATAQVLPTSSGSCGVAPSGLMSCEWLSPAPLKKADRSRSIQTVPSRHAELFVTRFNLSPGAPLTPLIEGQDVLIVGMGDGELINEAKSPSARVNVRNGSVLLMPREEHYLLRNIGKQDVDVLVVHIRR
jgi:mannose-6-phosphate isomerase-like protein (cupin superfamily)